MRIITGSLKGRKIPTPETEGVRPTADRTKEGLFSALIARTDLANAKILDLFAGSGNLGFEAISRGASRVLFVEENPVCVESIKKLGQHFSVEDRFSVQRMSVDMFLSNPSSSFDIIFSDPPYDIEGIPEMIEKVLNEGWLNEGGWFVLEHDKRHDFSDHVDCVFTKAYGRTIVSMFHRETL